MNKIDFRFFLVFLSVLIYLHKHTKQKSHAQVGPQERGKSRDAMRRVKQLVITKTLAGETRTMKFKVVDNPVWLQDSEWEQVVAVFSNGKAWQFSEWKYKTPVDLFHRCKLYAKGEHKILIERLNYLYTLLHTHTYTCTNRLWCRGPIRRRAVAGGSERVERQILQGEQDETTHGRGGCLCLLDPAHRMDQGK